MIGEWRQFTSTLTSVIWFRAQRLANMSSMWIPTTPHFLTCDILKFWSKELFLRCGGGGGGVVCADWGIWNDSYRFSPSLFPPFFARSHFHRSLVFFAPRHCRELSTGYFIATLKGIWILTINPAGNNVTSWWRHTMSLCQVMLRCWKWWAHYSSTLAQACRPSSHHKLQWRECCDEPMYPTI